METDKQMTAGVRGGGVGPEGPGGGDQLVTRGEKFYPVHENREFSKIAKFLNSPFRKTGLFSAK